MLAAEVGKPPGEQYGRSGIEMILDGDPSNGRWPAFHDGRCAMCGQRGQYLLEDHCHRSGQVRGMLCRGCNVREGVGRHPQVIRYQRIHPAAILDYHVMYSGRDWDMGWWVGDVRDPYTERPATPWPRWERDAPLDARR